MKRLFMLLMEGEGEGSGGGGVGGSGEGAGAGAGAPGNGGGNHENYVPYERFHAQNEDYKTLRTNHGELQTKFDEMSKTMNEWQAERDRASAPDAEKDFYKNPYGGIQNLEKTMKENMDKRFKDLEASASKKDKAANIKSATEWFRKQDGYSKELEEKAAGFIKENGLFGIPARQAIELAYKFVTFGDGSGYTRKEKEGLMKPAGGQGGDPEASAELAKLDVNDPDYDKKMRALHNKMTKK